MIGPFVYHVTPPTWSVVKTIYSDLQLKGRVMSSKEVAGKLIPKLHAVTLIRSPIRQPHWERRTLIALKLTKMHKTMIHKNTATVNGQLAAVKHLIKVQPVVFRTDMKNSLTGSDFFQDNGEFFIAEVPPDPPVDPRPAEKT